MSSLFWKSFAAGAAANLIVTHGLNMDTTEPNTRQMMAFHIAALGFMYGVAHGNTATVGFTLGMAAMAAGHYAMSVWGEEPADSKFTI